MLCVCLCVSAEGVETGPSFGSVLFGLVYFVFPGMWEAGVQALCMYHVRYHRFAGDGGIEKCVIVIIRDA